MPSLPTAAHRPPNDAVTACLVLADGTVFWGYGVGAEGEAIGELCFNTAMTGYQEILTDPSYAGQIITFTFPHIGNVGTNPDDLETGETAAQGLILREAITEASNYRAERHLDSWLASRSLVGISGVDTRRLTRKIRIEGPPKGIIYYARNGQFDIPALLDKAQAWPGLVGMDLAKEVTCRQRYEWEETRWQWDTGYGRQSSPKHHVVAVDYGIKRNILRSLATAGARVTVVPATATCADILGLEPDGVFLSNGPGDPAATGEYAVPVIRALVDEGLPVFGICLGHQMLGLAMGAKTLKMHQGHRGANHPVKELATGKVSITSMNHGFAVDLKSLPKGVTATHVSLFDGSLCGLELDGRPVFSVQYHPEASPGPQDSYHLFDKFMSLMDAYAEIR